MTNKYSDLAGMIIIALYLFFAGALSGYRSSKYWPKEITALSFLGKSWWCWGGVLAGAALMIADKGCTTGLLLALSAVMLSFSCVIFFMNCNKQIRLIAMIAIHALFLTGWILNF